MKPIRRSLSTSGIRIFFDRAQQIERAGHKVLHLEVGMPDWKLPPGVLEETKVALDEGYVHYIANRGLLALREAIAEDVQAVTGLHFDPETELLVTHGASEALSACGLALLGPGDEVILPQPAWNHYQAVVEMAGATPVLFPLRAEEGFLIDPERLAAAVTPQTKMLILNSPHNPTGAVQPAAVLEAVAKLAMEREFFVFADEIYQDLVFTAPHVSISRYMQDSPYLLYVNSFSKSYSMTGWRVGYLAGAAPIIDACNRIHQYLLDCGTAFAQKGVVNLLRHPGRQAYLEEMNCAFAKRHALWVEALNQCDNVQLPPAGGALYLFPQINYRGMNGWGFCQTMLEEHHIAMVPGEIFGQGYENHVRISFGQSLAVQQAAAAKLVDILQRG
ncbi:MAG: pyridoxal phosphate-dependent aminotransferase [Caldilineaceae bacterium]|nr:pyridoxal phosphate-dependent aminotransferase [Caldilineaceae bacterium]